MKKNLLLFLLVAISANLSVAQSLVPPAPLTSYSDSLLDAVSAKAKYLGARYCSRMDSLKNARTENDCFKQTFGREEKLYALLCTPSNSGNTEFSGFREQSKLETSVVDLIGTYELNKVALVDLYSCGLMTSSAYEKSLASINTYYNLGSEKTLVFLLRKDGTDRTQATTYVSSWEKYVRQLIISKR